MRPHASWSAWTAGRRSSRATRCASGSSRTVCGCSGPTARRCGGERRGRRAGGALAVAITNDPGSALGRAAEVVLGLGAGEERSVAATKTYTAELAVLARLAAHAGGSGARVDEGLAATAALAAGALAALPDA